MKSEVNGVMLSMPGPLATTGMHVYAFTSPERPLKEGVHIVYPTVQDLWAFWDFTTYKEGLLNCYLTDGPFVREVHFTATQEGCKQEVWEDGAYDVSILPSTPACSASKGCAHRPTPTFKSLVVAAEDLHKLWERRADQLGPFLEWSVWDYLLVD